MKTFLMQTLFIIFIMFLFSCNTEKNTIGLYRNAVQGVPCGIILKLNIDSTYYYEHYCVVIHERDFGKWKLSENKKKLILDSFISNFDSIPICVEEKRENNFQDKLFILDKFMRDPIKQKDFQSVRRNSKEDSIFWNIIINDTICFPIESDSLFISKEININNFYFQWSSDFTNRTITPIQDTVRSEVFYVKNNSNNFFEITFPFPKMGYQEIFYCTPLKDTLTIQKKSLSWNPPRWIKRVKLDKLE